MTENPWLGIGLVLGALTVTKRAGESLTPIEQKLVDDLARQAGLVMKNVGLTAELLARLEDLRASRQRLVAAQDEERLRALQAIQSPRLDRLSLVSDFIAQRQLHCFLFRHFRRF